MLAYFLLIGTFALPPQNSLASTISSLPPRASAAAWVDDAALRLAAAESSPAVPSQNASKKEPTPEQLMQARFPQPVKVGDLIGLPVLDWWDSTIGYVQDVVKTPEGKIQLVVAYGKWFGWLRPTSWLGFGRRPVAVPIEVMAILGRQIDALDIERKDFDNAPDWKPSDAAPIARDDVIQIAIGKR
jgi:hypothetical protein